MGRRLVVFVLVLAALSAWYALRAHSVAKTVELVSPPPAAPVVGPRMAAPAPAAATTPVRAARVGRSTSASVVSGRVVDESGQPVALAAWVRLNDHETPSDDNGEFRFEVPPG